MLLALFLLTQSPAQSAPEFGRRLEAIRTELGIPGMAAAIARDGRVVWTQSFGLADVENGKPVTDTTAFHLASLTKAFAAVVLLRLVDSGLVSLDDPISKYGVTLTGSSSDAVKVRHVFSMTSDGPVPGERYQYSGNRYTALERVIRQASGRSFAELARDWIIRPLGLSRTAPNVADSAFRVMGLDEGAYRAAMAKGYNVVEGRVTPGNYPAYFGVSAGMISTPSDVVRFAQALGAGKLLSTRMRELMFTPARTSTGAVLPYAFGCFSQVYRGVRVIWSYGLWNSISALLIHLPERGVSLAVLANADRLSMPYSLGNGTLLNSPVAREFLEAFAWSSQARLP